MLVCCAELKRVGNVLDLKGLETLQKRGEPVWPSGYEGARLVSG